MISFRRAAGIAAACALLGTAGAVAGRAADTTTAPSVRPPAVPLVTFNPYLSVWSEADKLTDDVTRHWTKRPHPLTSLIRIDGKTYRLMGAEPSDVPAFPQTGLTVLPTRSVYTFDDGHVRVKLTFLTPALPNDLDALARPLSYLTWQVSAVDGGVHEVSIYDSTSALLSVDMPEHKVTWGRSKAGSLTALHAGAEDQTVFQPVGDGVRVNWGYVYAAAPSGEAKASIGSSAVLAKSFIDSGSVPDGDDKTPPRAANADEPVLAFAFPLRKVGARPVERHAIVAYDEIWAVDWFYKPIRPYWKRNGESAESMLASAERDYRSLDKRSAAFDSELMADLTHIGGPDYATIGALAWRQCLAGCGLAADGNGKPLLFTKENTSNGDIATVDVIFPMDPMMVLFSPTLAKASLVPVLMYAESSHWKFPNAPHDLGTYPVAHGRDDGGEGMPVEESGNMLLLCDAIAQEEGNPSFPSRWWPQLTQWAKYLEQYGQDPENQLCTDDFMGHLAHNSNLSIKAILALAAYGDLCRMRGDMAEYRRYTIMARGFARHWMDVADDGGTHYRLAFDRANTWSQKYNLVWDRILGLNVFPPVVAATEVNWYKEHLNPLGFPLDSRTKLTKADWSVWSATLATNPSDFNTLISPTVSYLNATTKREAFADSYVTTEAASTGMHARPVIGGVFVRLLADPALWQKWSQRDTEYIKPDDWAKLPPMPVIKTAVPTAMDAKISWHWTTQAPGGDAWTKPGFDDSAWKEGIGGFGTEGTPGIVVGTRWDTGDIWLRRTITIPDNVRVQDLQLFGFHDENIQVYFDGVLAARQNGYITSYEPIPILPDARRMLKPGAKITLAVHCHQTEGGQGIDIGLSTVSLP